LRSPVNHQERKEEEEEEEEEEAEAEAEPKTDTRPERMDIRETLPSSKQKPT
jgi:hypothetical protein